MAARTADRERLSRADAANIVMDVPDQVNAFLMAGVLRPGGALGADGSVDLDRVRASLAARMTRIPRLSQRVARAGRTLVWEPVAVDLSRQVRAMDPVDGRAGLEALCARLMVTPMPLDRPLWELLVVPGVEPGGIGVVLRIHHALADGIASVRLVERLLAPETVDGGDSEDATDAAEPAHPDDVIAVEPATASPGRGGRRRLVTGVRAVLSGVQRTVGMLREAVPDTVLLGPIGSRRGVAFAEAPLDALAAGAATVGATLNDALLAAAVAAVEGALRAQGDPVPDVLPASVPVALGARGRSGNAVGVMLVRLPTGEVDLARRLGRIAALTREAKPDARRRGTFELTRTRLGARLFLRLARRQRLVVMFVTNVPGPRHPLDLAGARLEHAWPVTAIEGNVRLGIAAISYDGALRCAVHCDAAGVDAEVVSDGLCREFVRIAALV
ncbi:wax ester/triacylglycerol synthase domain-containing protein [Agromyces sp. SYSU T00266]|uniref:wax ester/triacylglycerol synthase domain-containing protein n=1 Tax=Agromyces zhanjiangensis TaxID=3158562 RepID=UPI003398634A